VKRMTKNVLRTIEMAMNAGVADVGAERRRFGAPEGKTDRSYTGSRTADVQLRGESLFGREQEPNAPKRTVGPSTFVDPPGCFSDVDGVTESKETWLLNTSTGEMNAKRDRSNAVRERRGAR